MSHCSDCRCHQTMWSPRKMTATALAIFTLSVGSVACSHSDTAEQHQPTAPVSNDEHGASGAENPVDGGHRAWEIISAFKTDNFFGPEVLSDQKAIQLFSQTMCKVEGEIGSYAGFDSNKVDYNDMRRALQDEGNNALKAIDDTDVTRQFIRDADQEVKDGKSYCQLAGN